MSDCWRCGMPLDEGDDGDTCAGCVEEEVAASREDRRLARLRFHDLEEEACS